MITVYRCRVRDSLRHIQTEFLFREAPSPAQLEAAIAASELCSCSGGRQAMATRYQPGLALLGEISLGRLYLSLQSLEITVATATLH